MEVNKVLVELEQLLADKAHDGVISTEYLWHFITAHIVQPEDGTGGLA